MRQLIINFLILALFVGCASTRVFTREEALRATQHTYSGVSKEELIKNAEKVLDLADGSDVSFSDNKNGFVAMRQWLIYAVIAATRGTDTWVFSVEEQKDGLLASVQVSQNAGSVMATGSSGAGVITSPNMGSIVQGPALYEMFWGRLDYLLDRRNDWPDCKSGLDKIHKKETWGSLEQICDSITLKDNLPDNLSNAEVERLFSGKEKYLKTRYLKSRSSNHN